MKRPMVALFEKGSKGQTPFQTEPSFLRLSGTEGTNQIECLPDDGHGNRPQRELQRNLHGLLWR